MGFSGISIWQLLIILVIVLLIFGTKRLKNIGSDLGGAIKGFKGAMSDDSGKEKEQKDAAQPEQLEASRPEAGENPAGNAVKKDEQEKV